MPDNRISRQFLQWLKSSGITHLPTVNLPEPAKSLKKPKAGGRVTPRPAAAAATSAGKQQPARPAATPAPPARPAPLAETVAILEKPMTTAAEKQSALQLLGDVVAGCQRCTPLAESRQQSVFGVGDPNASIMFVGEAPGADEDRLGEPFVGAAGQLLDKIIGACGWKREQIYICNVLRCRPPGNRNPLPQEALNCREFLDGQIRIVNPDYIVCWGTVAAQNLLQETRSVGRLRGQFLQHGNAKVLCTYHPSYLLRNPSAKKQVWEDMQLFMAQIEKDQGGQAGEAGEA
ncbi:MAG: uracil-DNA glycosylase [Planctomycetaceae bacterium]|nr:uracil-DNA glycosylase [Planctomycetaceae bacterium]